MPNLDDIQEASGGKRFSNYIALRCPFHGDSHPSLLAYEDGFECLACGERGSLAKLLAQLRGSPLPPLPSYRLPWRRWLRDCTVRAFCLKAHCNLIDYPEQRVYLRKRKVDHLIDKMQLGFIDGFYTFPVFDQKRQIVGVVARAGGAIQEETDLRYITPPDQEPMLYVPSWKRVLQSEIIYIVYGIIDALSLYSIGLPVVTWTTGKNLKAEALDSIRKPFIVVPDEHEENDALHLIQKLGWRGRRKFLDYPDGCKDPADIFQRFGPEKLYGYLAG